MKITEYSIVTGSIEDIKEKVNREIAKGWQPYEGLINVGYNAYRQVIVKYNK